MIHRLLRTSIFANVVLFGSVYIAQAQATDMSHASHPLQSDKIRFSTMLTVRDLSVSGHYYVHYLGFRVTEKMEGLRLLQRPGASIYLVTESPPTVDKPRVTLAPLPQRDRPSVNLVFRVPNVRATHKALSQLGLKFLAPPQQPSWGGWRCFAQDPDGYLIEFEQP